MSKAAQRREKQQWAVEKPKFDNARNPRGIYFIDSEEIEFKENMKKRAGEVAIACGSSDALWSRISSTGKPVANPTLANQSNASIVEAHESSRKRQERTLPKDHEDRIARKEFSSLSHYNLVHKFVPMPQAMNIPDAQVAVDKDWGKLENLPAWQMTKVNSKREVIQEAQKEQRTVHFATLMDTVISKFGVGTPISKYKGWVVLRHDTVKHDSGSYAVFTEQGCSAPQMSRPSTMANKTRARA